MEDKAEKVLKFIEEKATKVFLPIIGRKKGALLAQVVSDYQPKNILEIGGLVGYSAILIARNQKKGNIISLEISPKFSTIERKNIANAGFAEKVKVIEGDALETIPNLKEKFDLIFIDAAKDEYLSYITLLEKNKNLKEETIVVADNVKMFKQGVLNYLEHVRKSGFYSSTYHDFGEDGVEVSIYL